MAAKLDIDATLAKLNIIDKIRLLTGKKFWHTVPIPAHNIPSVRLSDGPSGVRGTHSFDPVPSSCFPCATGLGASFDVELAAEIGSRLGAECHAKSVHVLLGPTINTQRSPLAGRGFESFAEDPHLNGTIATAYINGLQDTGVAATVKHLVAHDQEYQRFSVSAEMSERALREIHLKPFQIAIKGAKPWALMSSYNRLNGLHCSENPRLLEEILRKEWGWKGMIMSDWTGVYSTAESIKAGVDLEMPGPTVKRGLAVARALQCEKLFPEDIDVRVRQILELSNRAIDSGIPFDGPEASLDTPATRAALRTAAAAAIVLLKNAKGLLPLRAEQHITSIALIGPGVKDPYYAGGGSAGLRPTYIVSPLDAITERAGKDVSVRWAVGTAQGAPVALSDALLSKVVLELWYENPAEDFLGEDVDVEAALPPSVWTTAPNNCGVDDTRIDDVCFFRYSADFTPDEDGDWALDMCIAGSGNLFVDGKLAFRFGPDASPPSAFLGLGAKEGHIVLKGLKAGTPHRIEVRMSSANLTSRGGVPFPSWGAVRLSAKKNIDDDGAIEDAIKLAKESDIAILIIGHSQGEGSDLNTIELPVAMNRLVTEVLKANPRTVVVNQSGTPVEMPWVAEAHTLVQAFYGGNEVGNGLADVLFGDVNPSGKLPLTFPHRLEDNPSYPSYGKRTEEPGKVLYGEGIFVGYRGYEIKKLKPMFAFGHGLSYTSFKYSALEVSPITSAGEFTVSFTIKNVGRVDGREVAQVYIADPTSSLPRPVKELKGFTKVTVKAGESKRATVKLDRHALSYYDERRSAWVAEAGTFDVLVAASSEDVRLIGQTELASTLVWTGL